MKNERDVNKAAKLAIELTDELKKDPTLLQPYLEIVLSTVLPTFGAIFPVDAKIHACDYWIFQPDYKILNILVASLKLKQSRQICQQYLKKWVKKSLISKTIDYTRDNLDQNVYSELLAVVFSIPDRVASAFSDVEKPQIAPLLKHHQYYTKLATSLTALDPIILSKFSILKLLDYVWELKIPTTIIAQSALELQPAAVSPFILSMIEGKAQKISSSVLAVIYPNNTRVQNLINSHFLTQKVLSDEALNILVDFLIGQGKTLETLERCGEIWSRHKLITQMSTALHRQLSLAILRLLPRTTKEQLTSCNATNLIMSGVSAHIGITSPEIRRYGLEIGERVTAILIPDQAVRFDELHPKEEEDTDELAPRKSILEKEDESDSDSDVDIDAPYQEGAGDDDSSEDEFIPYKIDDDEGADDQKVLHPRELIALFRTDENDVDRFKKFSNAIATAADIVKTMTKLELDQFGAEILNILLTVDNEYNQDDFDDHRRNAFVGLMTTFPKPVALMVIKELSKTRTHALGRKLQLLNAISYAASEMSELPKPEKKTVTIIEAHTRRWGRALNKFTRVSAVNKFSQCATNYFYGILHAADLEKFILEEDGLEVAQTLVTLAIVIEAAGKSVIELEQMSKDLLQVVMVLSPVRPPNARRALIFAATCAIQALPEYRGNDNLGEFLVDKAENDPDDVCRDMARNVCALLAQRHDDDLNNLIPGVSVQ